MKTLITGALPLDRAELDALTALGLEITVHPDERTPVLNPAQYRAVVCNGLFLYQPIEAFTALKLLQLTSAGLDRVPMDYIQKHGIRLFNARGVYSVPMAEYALCGVLSLFKKTMLLQKSQQQHQWQKQREQRELAGSTVCIVGCGSVGTACAKRFAALDCRVRGVDIAPYANRSYEAVLPLERLDYLISQSDITVLTLPLTAQTRGLMNAERFAQLKIGAVLVNIARGAIVDTQALLAWLQSPRSGGAVLDVFEQEPLAPDSPLWDSDKVVLTPHISYASVKNHKRMFDTVLQNLRAAAEEA